MQSGLLEQEAPAVAKIEGTSVKLAADLVSDAVLVVSFRRKRGNKMTVSDYLTGLLRAQVEKDLEEEKRLDSDARGKPKKAK